jgi:hypothetical protein
LNLEEGQKAVAIEVTKNEYIYFRIKRRNEMAKLIVKFSNDCYVNGPEFSSSYSFSEETNSFLTDTGAVDDESIIMVNNFIQKHKSLHKDIHKIFNLSEDYKVVMLEYPLELHLPEQSDDVFAKVFASNLDDKRGPGFGCEPFSDGFYKELFNVFQVEGDVDSDIRGSLCGNFEGYYEFEALLRPEGVLWDTIHYEEEDF